MLFYTEFHYFLQCFSADATDFLAASSKSSAVVIYTLVDVLAKCSSISLPINLFLFSQPSFELVPVSLTTRGTLRLTYSAALIIPSAMMLHLMIPPKMLMRIVLTLGWSLRISNAILTYSTLAPPPTSRKLAGSPPQSLMISIVAIARPAPLTMQPISPSSAT